MFSRVSQSLWTSTLWVLTPEVSDSSVIFTKPSQWETKINGFSDATLNEAAQILRLLHIEELRELQTKINEAIVAVQAIVANPKTDHRLGKVGRWEGEEGCWRKKGRDWKLNICHWTRDYFFLCCSIDQIVWVRSWKNTILNDLLICCILLLNLRVVVVCWKYRQH